MIKSKVRISLGIITLFMFLLFSFIAYGITDKVYFSLDLDSFKNLVPGLIVFSIGLLMLFFYLKIPKIILSKDHIIIKNTFYKKVYLIDDIESFKLTGKMPYKLFFTTFPTEGMCLKFTNGSIEYAFDDNYANLWEIKEFVEKKRIKHRIKKKRRYKKFKERKKIKGSFINLLGITAIVILVFTLFLFYSINWSEFKIVQIIPFLFFISITWLFGQFVYFYEFDSKNLIVKNRILFWYREEIDVNDIKEIVRETVSTRYISSESLRIIFNNFQSKKYISNSYRDNDWKDIKTMFNNAAVKFRHY